MATDIELLAGTPQTLANANGASTADAAANAAGTDLDNTTEKAILCDFELNGGFGSSVTAGRTLDLYLVPKLDGTNLADVGSAVFQPSHYRGTFVTPTAGTSARRMTIEGVALGPYLYTAYILNNSGQTLSANWTLKAFPQKYRNN